jgi:hypothetical protein
LSGLNTPPARADFTFGPLVNPGPTINSRGAQGPCFSADGLELYFSPQDQGSPSHIYVSRRATLDSEWSVPIIVGLPVDSPASVLSPSLSVDGLSLYFQITGNRLRVSKRATTHDDWGPPVSVGEAVNADHACTPCISADELELYFFSRRSGGYGDGDLWVTTRATVNDGWGAPVNLGPTINTPSYEGFPGISPDGLLLFFGSNRPGGSGGLDVYVARRATRKDPWGPPTNTGPMINSNQGENGPKVTFDGSMLYFFSGRLDGYYLPGQDIWQAPILPVVDFNGDGKVDTADMAILVANWGESNSVSDIGPFPWGDGVVDERDLRVFTESSTTPGPKASDVLCDVILSWISPSFAQTCDVYLGTSFEAVSSADRTNPQGVLVSQGQAAAAYDPPGLLDLSQTYYWRVDFVVPGPAPTIYKGAVLQFTTAALTYQIKNVIATASSVSPGSGPERTVDGSGLDKNDGHSTDQKDMWWSLNKSPSWIQYELDKIYTLHELWVWNFNQVVEPFVGFGAKSVKIEYSADGTTWTALANVPEFAKASGKPGYTANTIVSFAGVPAKFVKLTIEKNWGVAPQTGLSEVRFFCIQTAAVAKP